MSLEETWRNANNNKDDELSLLLNRTHQPVLPSHNPLQRIKRNLLYNIFFAAFICAGYVLLIVNIQVWQVQLALIITLVFSLWCIYTSWMQYKKLDAKVDGNSSLLQEMKRHYHSIQQWIKTQLQVSVFVYPFSAAGGFLLGGTLGSGKPVDLLLGKPLVQVSLLTTLVVLVPLAYFLSRWLFKISFGKYLDMLQNNIDALEHEK